MNACPHCGGGPGPHGYHVCADRERWTQAERDEWRAQARRRSPWLQFTPSTAELARRLGAHSQR